MADTHISAAEVQAALGMTAAQLPDATLATAFYIPACDAAVDRLVTFSSLVDPQKALVKAAEIALCCEKVILRPPAEDFDFGVVKGKDVVDRKTLAAQYHEMWIESMEAAGTAMGTGGAASVGGADYHPSGVDTTNIDLGYATGSGTDAELNMMGGDTES